MTTDDLARGRAHDPLMETLADAEHASWARWMEYLMGCCERHVDGSLTIPAVLVERWRHQAATPYADLSEREKESDREEVRRILPHVAPRAALLDAAERAARLEVAAREALAVMEFDHAVTGDVDHATNEAARLLRAALERPKGAGDE